MVPCFNESVPYLIEFGWKITKNNKLEVRYVS